MGDNIINKTKYMIIGGNGSQIRSFSIRSIFFSMYYVLLEFQGPTKFAHQRSRFAHQQSRYAQY